MQDGSPDSSRDTNPDFVEFLLAGVHVKGEFHCAECGYGVDDLPRAAASARCAAAERGSRPRGPRSPAPHGSRNITEPSLQSARRTLLKRACPRREDRKALEPEEALHFGPHRQAQHDGDEDEQREGDRETQAGLGVRRWRSKRTRRFAR